MTINPIVAKITQTIINVQDNTNKETDKLHYKN